MGIALTLMYDAFYIYVIPAYENPPVPATADATYLLIRLISIVNPIMQYSLNLVTNAAGSVIVIG